MSFGAEFDWTGPLDSDLKPDSEILLRAVPPERWPYGPPQHHEAVCRLHAGGLYCDCAASAADDTEWGAGGWSSQPRCRP